MSEVKFLECKKVKFATDADKALRTFDKKFAINLAGSIAEQGLLQPIAVWADPASPDMNDPEYIGIDGRHRYHAVHKVLKKSIIECKVFLDMDQAEAHIAAVAANLWRNNLSPAQYAQSIKVWFDYYKSKHPDRVAKSNRPDAESGDVTIPVASLEAAAEAPAEAGEPVEVKNFAETVSDTTGQSLASAKRTQRIATSFDADQLAAFDAAGTSKTDMLTIAKIKNKDKKGEVVNLVASGMEPTVAIARICGDQAPDRDNGNKSKAERKAAAEAAKADVEPALSNDEWFEKECGEKASLIAIPDKYRAEAILYRKNNESRHAYRGKAKADLREVKDAKLNGPLFSWISRLINMSHPKDWFLCSGCGGKCLTRPQENPNDNDALCQKCWGAGYAIKTESYL